MEKFRSQSAAVAVTAALGLSACSGESAPQKDRPAIESADPDVTEVEEAPALEGIEQDISREKLVSQLFGTDLDKEKKHEQFGNYILFNFGDPEIARLQEDYALDTMEWLLANEPYQVQVDGEIQTVSFNRPSEEAPRVISFVPELEDISKVVPGDESKGPRTHKDYLVVDGEPRLYSAMSGIHQDLEDSTYSGPFGAAAIEWCQMLDMKLRDYHASEDSNLSKFQAAQEGICNSIGTAVNVTTAGEGYDFYEQLVQKRYLGEPASQGHEVLYPILSREEFASLRENILPDK